MRASTRIINSGQFFNEGTTKTPLAQSLHRLATAKANEVQAQLGVSLPCTVSAVTGTIDGWKLSPWIVQINFEVTGKTLPKLVVPVLAPPYIAYPIQVGDKGLAIAASARLGALTGLGGGTPPSIDETPGNLSCLSFAWLGNASFTSPDPQAICLLEPTNNCQMLVGPTGVVIQGTTGDLSVSGSVSVGNGATGSFTTPSGQTVMVQNGIITNIY
jgi:hypothetical protein